MPIILIFAIMYFLMIRPQQKKVKEHKAMVEALRRGDQVVTSGGLIGKVTKVADGEVEVELPPSNVKVRVVQLDNQPGGEQDRARRGLSDARAPAGRAPGDPNQMLHFPPWKKLLVIGDLRAGIVIALPEPVLWPGRARRTTRARRWRAGRS